MNAPFSIFHLVFPLFFFGFIFLVFAFWIWMLIEVATREPAQGNDKIVWILVVVLTNWIGALIYFFVRRPERIRLYGR